MSYETVRGDAAWATSQPWLYAVLDEGHTIRNTKSKIAQARFTQPDVTNSSSKVHLFCPGWAGLALVITSPTAVAECARLCCPQRGSCCYRASARVFVSHFERGGPVCAGVQGGGGGAPPHSQRHAHSEQHRRAVGPVRLAHARLPGVRKSLSGALDLTSTPSFCDFSSRHSQAWGLRALPCAWSAADSSDP